MATTPIKKLIPLSGLLAAILAIIVIAIGAHFEAGFTHTTHLVSELNAQGSSHPYLIGYLGFIPIGLLTLTFLWALKQALPRSAKATTALSFIASVGIDWLVTTLAPCDKGCPSSGDISISQQIHIISGVISLLLPPIGILLLISLLKQTGVGRSISVLALASAACFITFFALLAGDALSNMHGLIQRINLVLFYGFLSALNIRLLSSPFTQRQDKAI